MEADFKLSSKMEDYLEVISILNKEKGVVRVKDISRKMNVKNPSVSGALSTLESNDLIRHEKYGYVVLTEKGKRIARDIQKKHNVLLRFLTLVLKIDRETAERDSCKLEHAISPQTLEKLTKFIEFVETFPEKDIPEWLKSFYNFVKTGKIVRSSNLDIFEKDIFDKK
ncbi:MAG: metal-dependent transcriptional regulator [Spirochaetota bacterium]